MNHTKISKILTALFAVIFCFGPAGLAELVGTAFTYQGRLLDTNQPADGPYDLQFKLYDSASDGNKIGGEVNLPETQVNDGYFTVELDFGSGVFNGNRRWLEIGVRPGDLNDPNIYTILSPRAELTATPYGLYSSSSGTIKLGAGSISVSVSSLSWQNAGTVAYNYMFTSEPVVLITGTNDGGCVGFLQPHAVNITNSSFDLLLANPTSQPCSGTYNYNWAAIGKVVDVFYTWYKDYDDDGYSDGTSYTGTGEPPFGYHLASELIATSGDCNDEDAAINPGAEDVCDGVDNDCDGQIDEGENNPGCTDYYLDLDGDGNGTGESKCLCQPDGLYSATNDSDCDDENAAINPGAEEVYNGVDDNCDGQIDEGCCPPDGTPCNDGNACTVNDMYQECICAGTDIFCEEGFHCESGICVPD